MKVWKRNAIVATVLVLICAGVYLNWNASQNPVMELTDTLDAEQVMNQTVIDLPNDSQTLQAESSINPEDSFAQIRLSRQESRDSAVALLQETIAMDGDQTAVSASAETLDLIVSDALAEAQIESLIIAKGYTDCVAYMSEDKISVAVSAPEDGLSDADIALISDIVTSQTDNHWTAREVPQGEIRKTFSVISAKK